jgi:hypothetical protein
MIKKIILTFLAFLVLSLSFVPTAYAQTGTWYNSSFQDWFTKVNDSPENEIFGERYTAAQVQWVIYGLFYFVINASTNGNADAISCLMTSSVDECRDMIENMLSSVANPNLGNPEVSSFFKTISSNPISLSSYLRDVRSNLRLVPKAEAQGFGFQAANPTMNLWKIARNFSYALLIIVLVAMAFMIMFRVKISPQTVITVQSALPKIVVALILITFSYAIAGLLIDLMYVAIGIITALITSSTPRLTTAGWSETFNLITNLNAFDMFMRYWVMYLVGTFFTIFSGAFPVAFFAFLFSIIAFFVLLWYSIKVIILLLKTYIQIMVLVIVAPFQILLGTIMPGAGFGPWLRNMAANLAVYPVVSLMFILAFLFVRAGLPDWWPSSLTFFKLNEAFLSGTPWDPPMTFGTGGTNTSKLLWILLSYGVVIMIPKVAEIIQGFMSGKPFAYGAAVGEAVGPIKGAGLYGAAYGLGLGRRAFGPTGPGEAPQSPKLFAAVQTLERIAGIKPSS